MKKAGLLLIIICACLVSVWIVVKKYDRPAVPKACYTIPRSIQYSFTLQNKTNRVMNEAEFWAYAPVKQTATQQCVDVETSYPSRLIPDNPGNQILYFNFHDIPPYATRIITIKADLLLSDRPNQIAVKDLRPYLQAEKYCESDDPEILRLANKLKAPEPVKTAENIFRWVAGNVQYAGYIKNVRGALHALRNKKGDCTEFMYLFAALCRANGIPARGIGGYVLNENAVLKPNDYHNWVEFYNDGAWRIADPQKKIFMPNRSHYIAMQVINGSIQNPLGNYQRFRFAGDGLKVKMNR